MLYVVILVIGLIMIWLWFVLLKWWIIFVRLFCDKLDLYLFRIILGKIIVIGLLFIIGWVYNIVCFRFFVRFWWICIIVMCGG